jgi:hypothetical protein
VLIIIDKKLPAESRVRLSVYGALLELETEGIVYPAISGHPDIFFCKTLQTLIISPSLPEKYVQRLKEQHLQLVTGIQATGIRHPGSVHYNAAVSDRYLVHRLEYTDPVILQNCHTLKKIPVKQAYTRCNLVLLKENRYITSDPGIHKNLKHSGLEGMVVSPAGILLPGFKNGFIGGAIGVLNDEVLVIGKLEYFAEGKSVRNFLERMNYQIVELYDGPLFDGGGILFI